MNFSKHMRETITAAAKTHSGYFVNFQRGIIRDTVAAHPSRTKAAVSQAFHMAYEQLLSEGVPLPQRDGIRIPALAEQKFRVDELYGRLEALQKENEQLKRMFAEQGMALDQARTNSAGRAK